ncbi:hypothetical protein BT96DRAFT_747781, partial [Gymnopus androsaceus JB14]
DWSYPYNNLGIAHLLLYRHSSDVQYLERSIQYHSQALHLRTSNHVLRFSSCMNMANSFLLRFERNGNPDDFTCAMGHYREAVALCPMTHSQHSLVLGNMAECLRISFQLTAKPDILEEGISILHHVCALVKKSGNYAAMNVSLFMNLGNLLITRFTLAGNTQDIDEAIQQYQSFLNAVSIDHYAYAECLSGLGSAFQSRFQLTGSADFLEESINCHRQAVNSCSDTNPRRLYLLNNLANTLDSRNHWVSDLEEGDFQEAIDLHRMALSLTSSQHPKFSVYAANLGMSLSLYSYALSDIVIAEEAMTLFQNAVENEFSSVLDRLSAAVDWAFFGRTMARGHRSTTGAYTHALQALQQCLVTCSTVEIQHALLASSRLESPTTLASDAASYAVELGSLKEAVEILEQGRTLLWSELRSLRTPLTQLRTVNENLAQDYTTTCRALEILAVSSHDAPRLVESRGTTALEILRMRRQELMRKRDGLLSVIRALPGFENFLKAVRFDTLRMAASKGPVILINLSIFRSDAIILYSNDTLDCISLSTDIPSMMQKISTEITRTEAETIRYSVPYRPAGDVMTQVFRSLWIKVCKPVVQQLRIAGVKEQTRIWWCPTGKLAELPIHAAGPYSKGEKNLSDIFISSYTSTLCSLIRARDTITEAPRLFPSRLLAVGQLKEELKNLEDIFGSELTTMRDTDATSDAVVTALQNHPWVHLACHGNINPTLPFRSGFKLHEGYLTLLQIMEARLPNAELAFMAACHSAAVERRTPDENISLVAALQFCGFRSTVGTLWTMWDGDGPALTKEFYTYLMGEGGGDPSSSAISLHLATKAMRDRGVQPERWATFVHIG